MEVTKQTLIDQQIKVVETAQENFNECAFVLKGLCKEVLMVQKSILRKLGHREPRETTAKAYSKKGFFKKPTKLAGELEVDAEVKDIENKAKKGFFKANDVLEAESKPIENNKAKEDAFKAEEVVSDATEKANPKRLNQVQIGNIKQLASEGYNPVQISDELMIVIQKVNGVLAKMKKKAGGNLLASSNKKGSSLENEIKG